MSALHSYLALAAADQRKAVQKTTWRHVHIASRPLVLVGYHLAGDVGAPLALMWGTEKKGSRLVVIPEPRNRQLRFDVLKIFATEFVAYLDAYGANSPDAPQIVVPNRATADWLFGIVGRFTRSLPLSGNPAPHAIVPLAGMHLSFFHNQLPGSSLVIPATEALTIHWQTGQLPSEDLNLSALLGWIAPCANEDGPTCARRGEDLPPAGPLTDPNWDASTLIKLIEAWNAAKTDAEKAAVIARFETSIREQLDHTWDECWHALDLLGDIQEAPSAVRRWESDRETWAYHYAAITDGIARFRNIPTPIQSAKKIRRLEEATQSLEADMALDDPLVLAKYIATGEALPAKVLNVNLARARRPLLTMEPLPGSSRPRVGTFFLASNPGVELEIRSCSSACVTAEVVAGACQRNTHSRLPSVGAEIVLSPFGKPGFYRSREYEEVPWTHHLADNSGESTND